MVSVGACLEVTFSVLLAQLAVAMEFLGGLYGVSLPGTPALVCINIAWNYTLAQMLLILGLGFTPPPKSTPTTAARHLTAS